MSMPAMYKFKVKGYSCSLDLEDVSGELVNLECKQDGNVIEYIGDISAIDYDEWDNEDGLFKKGIVEVFHSTPPDLESLKLGARVSELNNQLAKRGWNSLQEVPLKRRLLRIEDIEDYLISEIEDVMEA